MVVGMWLSWPAVRLLADNCSGAVDCKAVPPNIDLATVLVSIPPLLILGPHIVRAFTRDKTRDKDKVPATAADFAKPIHDAMKEFERLQLALKESVDDQLRGLRQFNDAYNEQLLRANDDLDEYRDTYHNLRDDLHEIWDRITAHKLGRKIADWTDTTLGVIQVAAAPFQQIEKAAVKEAAATRAVTKTVAADASEAAQAERAATKIARAEQEAVAIEREAAAVKRELAAAKAEVATVDESTQAANKFRGPDGKPVGQLLQTGEGGKEQLRSLMSRYKATQNKIYPETINKMAQEMIDGTFKWPTGGSNTIKLRDGVIVDGHHRLIAAEMAAQATGRPAIEGVGAIIPEGAIEISGKAANKADAIRGWDSVNLKAGPKPEAMRMPDRLDDADLKTIRDLFPFDDE
jgi:hypothetical protein